MRLNSNRLIVLELEYNRAFSMLGQQLAEELGAQFLIYAAVAYYSFDEEFYMQSVIDSNPQREESIMWWLDDIYSELYNFFENIRTYHSGNQIEEVVFDSEVDTIYVSSRTSSMFSSGP